MPEQEKHKRKWETEVERTRKRIAVTVESLLRHRYGIPNPLDNPYPVSSQIAIQYLQAIVASDTESEHLSPLSELEDSR